MDERVKIEEGMSRRREEKSHQIFTLGAQEGVVQESREEIKKNLADDNEIWRGLEILRVHAPLVVFLYALVARSTEEGYFRIRTSGMDLSRGCLSIFIDDSRAMQSENISFP